MPFLSNSDSYESCLEWVQQRLQTGRLRIRIPDAVGLYRSRPGAYFHPTPELFIQTGGATDFECPDGPFRLITGDICVMPAGVPHAEMPVNLNKPYGVAVVMQGADGCVLNRGRANIKGQIESHDVICFSGGVYAFRCLEQVAKHLTIHRVLRRNFVEGLIQAFLAAVLTEIKNPTPAERQNERSPLVSEAEKLVLVEISKPDMTVASVAKRLRCSPDHLTRCFRAEIGVTLNIWITQARVQLACELLAQPRHSIAEVGWTCGFSSPSYFIRVFRAHTGVTPRAWRCRAGSAV